jgi:hypothetical protein
MRISRGNQGTRRKPAAPVPLYLTQIPHDLTWARTRAAAVRTRRVTACAMAQPCGSLKRQLISKSSECIGEYCNLCHISKEVAKRKSSAKAEYISERNYPFPPITMPKGERLVNLVAVQNENWTTILLLYYRARPRKLLLLLMNRLLQR